MADTDLSGIYGKQYYQGYYDRSPHWFSFFGHVAECLIDQFHPRKTLDAGCAWGLLVEVLRDKGIEAYGIDFSSYALQQVRQDIQPYCRRASLVEPIIGGPYDLVSCIEVLEHMVEADALRAIENLTSVTDVILFSSTPYDFDDPTHINVQPLVYWLRSFARHGFYPVPESDAGFVSDHAFLLRRSSTPSTDESLNWYAQMIERRRETRLLSQQLQSRRLVAYGSPESAELLWQAEDAIEALREIHASPAWKLVGRYRSWLDRLRLDRPGLTRAWEIGTEMALRPLRRGTPKQSAQTPESWDYAAWIQQNEPTEGELLLQTTAAKALAYRPKFSVIMPVYEISTEILRAAVSSLQTQTYDSWELCASVIPTLSPKTAAFLQELADRDGRFRVTPLESNLGISGNSNRALELATGEFVALLDHDDVLAPFALYEVAKLLNDDPKANLIYSDRDEINEDGSIRSSPFFKPDWSPEVLMSANYMTHLSVIRAEHLRDVGGWRSETDGAQDWDLFLRVAHKHGEVRHIPQVLYHWRHAPSSTAVSGLDGKPYAKEAQVRAVQAHCRDAQVGQSAAFIDGHPKIVWRINDLPKVSVVVLSHDVNDEVVSRAESIAERLGIEGLEVLCSVHDGYVGSAHGVICQHSSAVEGIVERANRLVAASSGEVVVFIDTTIGFETNDWFAEIVGPLSLPGVGLCGCHLVHHQSGSVRQVGIVFDREGKMEMVRPGRQKTSPFLPGWAHWLRNWSAASGACFAMERATWDAVGGLAAPSTYSRPDVRLCLKLAEQGLRVVTNPLARVRQTGLAALELPLVGQDETDQQIVKSIFPHGDPYLNPHLQVKNGILAPR